MIARTHGDEDAANDGRAYGMAVWNGGEARTVEVAKHSNRYKGKAGRNAPPSPFGRENKIHVGFLASSDRLLDLRLVVVNRSSRISVIVLLLVVDARDEQNLCIIEIGWKVHEDH